MLKGIAIALFTIVLTLIITLIQNKFIDRKTQIMMQKNMRENQKAIKELLNKGDDESSKKAKELQQKMLEESIKTMNQSTKSMMAVLIVVVPMFAIISKYYGNVVLVNSLLGKIIPFFGAVTWFWWYFLIALPAGNLISNLIAVFQTLGSNKR